MHWRSPCLWARPMSYTQIEAKISQDVRKRAPGRCARMIEGLQNGSNTWDSEHLDRRVDYFSELARHKDADPELRENASRLRSMRDNMKSGSFGIDGAGEAADSLPRRAVAQRRSIRNSTDDTVGAIAEFLHKGEEDIHLRAVRGELVFDLADCRSINAPGSGVVALPPTLQSWASEDDRLADAPLLELQGDCAKLVQLVREVADMVEEDQAKLDLVEEGVAEAREQVEAAVHTLGGAATQQRRLVRRLIVPVGAGVIVALMVPGVAQCGAVCLVSKVAVGSAGMTIAGIGSQRIEGVKGRAMEQLQARLSDFVVGKDHIDSFVAIGDEMEHRLADMHPRDGKTGWRRMALCVRGHYLRLPIYYKRSFCRETRGTRLKGYAYMTQFEANVSPQDAFREVLRQHCCGSTDASCSFSWNFPVRGKLGVDDTTTGARTTVFSSNFFDRVFRTVSRTGYFQRTQTDPERFFLAVGSTDNNDLPGAFTQENCELQLGFMHLSGIAVDSVYLQDGSRADDKCRVYIMLDLDPCFPLSSPATDFSADHILRQRICEVACGLRAKFEEASRQGFAPA